MADYTSEHTGVEIDLAVENANLMLLTGSEDPATSTVGTLGQIYQNATNGTLFRCTNIAGETYTWTEWADYSLAEKAKVTNATTNVGDLTYTEDNYVTDEESLTESVDALDVELKDANDRAGTLASLTTTEKGSLVGAINEVDDHADTNATSIGTLASLTTTEKTNLVGAINEVDADVGTNATAIGTLASLTTTEKTNLVGAINELDTDKIETSAITNTLTETAAGKVLDARQGKTLSDKIGTQTFTEDNYVTDGQSATASIDKLDMAVKDNADLISNMVVEIPNFVLNGAFEDTTNWTASYSTHAAASNVLSNTGDGTASYCYESQVTNIPVENGKKVYGRAKVKVTNTACSGIFLRWNGSNSGITTANTNVASQVPPTQDTVYTLSGVVTLSTASTTGNVRLMLRHQYADSTTASGKVMEIQEVLAVDLTDTFGVGNEPTAIEMDTLLSIVNWWDGIMTPTMKQTLNWILALIRIAGA